jgi:hypothetical protein
VPELHDGREEERAEVGPEIAGGAGGALVGGAIGAAVAGPVGAVVGAGIGAVAGASGVGVATGQGESHGTEISAAATPGTMGSGSTGAVGAPLGATAQAAVKGVARDEAAENHAGTPGLSDPSDAYTTELSNEPEEAAQSRQSDERR